MTEPENFETLPSSYLNNSNVSNAKSLEKKDSIVLRDPTF